MSLFPFVLLPTPSCPQPSGFLFTGLTPCWKMTKVTLIHWSPAGFLLCTGAGVCLNPLGAMAHRLMVVRRKVLAHFREAVHPKVASARPSTVGVSRRIRRVWKSSLEGLLRGGQVHLSWAYKSGMDVHGDCSQASAKAQKVGLGGFSGLKTVC